MEHPNLDLLIRQFSGKYPVIIDGGSRIVDVSLARVPRYEDPYGLNLRMSVHLAGEHTSMRISTSNISEEQIENVRSRLCMSMVEKHEILDFHL